MHDGVALASARTVADSFRFIELTSSVLAVTEVVRGSRFEEVVPMVRAVETDGRIAVTGGRLRQRGQLGAGRRGRTAAAADRRALMVDPSGGVSSTTGQLVAGTSPPVAGGGQDHVEQQRHDVGDDDGDYELRQREAVTRTSTN